MIAEQLRERGVRAVEPSSWSRRAATPRRRRPWRRCCCSGRDPDAHDAAAAVRSCRSPMSKASTPRSRPPPPPAAAAPWSPSAFRRGVRKPATATSAAARRSRESTAAIGSSDSSKSRMSRRPSRYVAEGDYPWNCGMFVLPVDAFCAEVERLQPGDAGALPQGAATTRSVDLDFLRLDRESFARAPSISIDYAVMETDRQRRDGRRRHRLERCRLLVGAVGNLRARRRRQRRDRRRRQHRRPATATFAATATWSRRSASTI